MNEELTNEDKVFSAWLNDAATSLKCVWTVLKPEFTTRLARMYFEERAKPKVWDGAPETAIKAEVFWSDEDNFTIGHKCFTRELPKTRARQIAEKISAALSSQDRYKPDVKIIEAVLEKYAEESEGKECK